MNPLIIIPTHNEVENIEKLIQAIDEILTNVEYSILVVDDASTDGTKEVVLSLQTIYSNLYFFSRKKRYGLANAYISGFTFGIKRGFDAFIQMDADFSHNPVYLTNFIKLLENYDLVIGSRNIKGGATIGWSPLRNFISKCGSLYSRLILKCPIMDLTGGYNAWSLNALYSIDLDNIISKGYSFQIEMKYKAYKNRNYIKEFPIIFEDRKYGKSKMSFAIFLEAIFNVIKIKGLN